MAAVKNHWRFAVVNCFLLVVILLIILGYSLDQSPAQAQANRSNDELARLTRVQLLQDVEEVRRELCLEGRDLAAFGCTQGQAESILQSLITWCTQNRDALAQSRSLKRRGENAITDARRKASIGPRMEQRVQFPAVDASPEDVRFVQLLGDEEIDLAQFQTYVTFAPPDDRLLARISVLQSEVQAASQRYEALIESLKPVIAELLPGQQNEVWTSAMNNKAALSRHRYVTGLTKEQGHSLRVAQLRFGSGSPQAQRIEHEVLGPRAAQIDLIQGIILQRSPGVREAERTTLPKLEVSPS